MVIEVTKIGNYGKLLRRPRGFYLPKLQTHEKRNEIERMINPSLTECEARERERERDLDVEIGAGGGESGGVRVEIEG